jgi:squalene synthase HpnC
VDNLRGPNRLTAVFDDELKCWGPQGLGERRASLSEAEAYCRKLATSHSENFPVVTRMLPRAFRQNFYNVYAYCRWSDDLGDEVDGAERSLALLGWWKDLLSDCYAQRVRHPVFVALRSTIEECQIPPQPFEDLLSAFEQDQRVLEYSTFAELLDYCRRSANPVGRLVLYVCGEHNDANADWSDSICTGLQLANFWQDVSRDFDMGRVYLPQEDRNRFGYNDAELRNRTTNPAFLELMRFEVERAQDFLRAGLPLVDHLPGRLQVDVELFVRGGMKILQRIEAIGYRVWDRRPVVTKVDFAGLFLVCLGSALRRRLGRLRRKLPAVDREL